MSVRMLDEFGKEIFAINNMLNRQQHQLIPIRVNIPQNKSHSARNVGIGTIVIFSIIVILFVPMIPFSYIVEESTVTTQTNTIPTSKVITETVPVQQNRNYNLLNLGTYRLEPNESVHGFGQLSAGRDVLITWSANDTVDIYAFNTAQYDAYKHNSGDANPIVSQKNVASGTLGFRTSAYDMYYIVVLNPHSVFFGLVSKNVTIYSATAVATWQETWTVTTTQTIIFHTTTIQTVTDTHPTTKQTLISLLDWLLGRHP